MPDTVLKAVDFFNFSLSKLLVCLECRIQGKLFLWRWLVTTAILKTIISQVFKGRSNEKDVGLCCD